MNGGRIKEGRKGKGGRRKETNGEGRKRKVRRKGKKGRKGGEEDSAICGGARVSDLKGGEALK